MKYNSVVISGLPGAGKGVLSKAVAQKYGWKLFSIGDMWRKKWEKEHPSKEIPFENYWKKASFKEQNGINNLARQIIAEGQAVGDFRYAICCKGLPTLFVFIKSNLDNRAERATKTKKYEGKQIAEIKKILKDREKDEVMWGKKLFGKNYDFRDNSHYNLILDSEHLTLQEEVALIDKELKDKL